MIVDDGVITSLIRWAAVLAAHHDGDRDELGDLARAFEATVRDRLPPMPGITDAEFAELREKHGFYK